MMQKSTTFTMIFYIKKCYFHYDFACKKVPPVSCHSILMNQKCIIKLVPSFVELPDSLHCLMHFSPPPEAVLGGESESLDGSEISELINSRHLKRFSSS
jgi:hypothetical protein